MPVYSHYREVLKEKSLPMAEQVGACITCSWWAVETPRPADEIDMVGVCKQPQLAPLALVVSGSSACNKWNHADNVGEDAEKYSHKGEEMQG